MRKLYPTKAWCNKEGMTALKPVGLQSDCKGAILMNRGMWLDLRHKMFVINNPWYENINVTYLLEQEDALPSSSCHDGGVSYAGGHVSQKFNVFISTQNQRCSQGLLLKQIPLSPLQYNVLHP